MPSRAVLENVVMFLIAGTLVVLIRWLGKSGNHTLAGVFTMFPMLTATSVGFLLLDTPPMKVRGVLISSAWSVPAVLVFVLTLYVALKHFNGAMSLVTAFAAWTIAIFTMLTLRRYV